MLYTRVQMYVPLAPSQLLCQSSLSALRIFTQLILSKLFTIRFILIDMKNVLYLAWEKEKEVKLCKMRCVLFRIFVVSQ